MTTHRRGLSRDPDTGERFEDWVPYVTYHSTLKQAMVSYLNEVPTAPDRFMLRDVIKQVEEAESRIKSVCDAVREHSLVVQAAKSKQK